MRGVDGVKSCGARAAGESWPAGGWRSSAACRAAVALALLVSGCVKPYDPFRIGALLDYIVAARKITAPRKIA